MTVTMALVSVATIVVGLCCWILLFSLCALPLSLLYIWQKIVCLCAAVSGWIGGPKLVALEPRDIDAATEILSQNATGTVDSCSVGVLLRIQERIDIPELRRHFLETFPSPDVKYVRLFCTIRVFLGYPFFNTVTSLDLIRQIYGVTLKKGETPEIFLATWLKQPYPEDGAC